MTDLSDKRKRNGGRARALAPHVLTLLDRSMMLLLEEGGVRVCVNEHFVEFFESFAIVKPPGKMANVKPIRERENQ